MSDDPRALLEAGLRALRIPDSARVTEKLLEYGALILEHNQSTNLTGARDLRSLISSQFLDSLAPLRLIPLKDPIVDLGSGAGLPGIPAAIVNPTKQITLLEPRAKRADFLGVAIAQLGLSNVCVVKSSALGPRAANLVGRVGTVLIRAVAEPAEAFRLGLPLLMRGGTLLLYQGKLSKPTSQQREQAAQLGAGRISVIAVRVPHLAAIRHAWLTTKKLPS